MARRCTQSLSINEKALNGVVNVEVSLAAAVLATGRVIILRTGRRRLKEAERQAVRAAMGAAAAEHGAAAAGGGGVDSPRGARRRRPQGRWKSHPFRRCPPWLRRRTRWGTKWPTRYGHLFGPTSGGPVFFLSLYPQRRFAAPLQVRAYGCVTVDGYVFTTIRCG